MEVLVAQSCLTLCDPMDCGLPGSPVHGILQARILEWHLLQRIVPTQELNLGLLYCRWILSLLSYQGILCIYIYIYVNIHVYIYSYPLIALLGGRQYYLHFTDEETSSVTFLVAQWLKTLQFQCRESGFNPGWSGN